MGTFLCIILTFQEQKQATITCILGYVSRRWAALQTQLNNTWARFYLRAVILPWLRKKGWGFVKLADSILLAIQNCSDWKWWCKSKRSLSWRKLKPYLAVPYAPGIKPYPGTMFYFEATLRHYPIKHLYLVCCSVNQSERSVLITISILYWLVSIAVFFYLILKCLLQDLEQRFSEWGPLGTVWHDQKLWGGAQQPGVISLPSTPDAQGKFENHGQGHCCRLYRGGPWDNYKIYKLFYVKNSIFYFLSRRWQSKTNKSPIKLQFGFLK